MSAAASVPGRSAGFRFRVFLSYSHADRRWARRALRWLEGWTVPRRLIGRETPFGPVPRRLAPVFRDREELGPAPELSESIGRALVDSASMLVLCSPAAAQSRWVNEEILAFKRLGRGDRIVALIVAGDPAAGDGPEQCFPPALRFRLEADGELGSRLIEPVAADARDIGDAPRRARRKVQAALLGIPYGELARREQQRRNRRLAVVTAASVIGMAGTLALSFTAWRAQQDAERRRAQAEDLVGFMLGDLRDRVEPIGRLDLLHAVGDEAVSYFSRLGPRDLDDRALAQQVKALTQVGEVQLSLGNSEQALTAFDEAWRRAAELATRYPAESRLLYDRGQAEFWVGYVHRERGDLAAAREWLTRYRDTALQLHQLDPDDLDARLELAYGERNLGALAFGEGRLAEAEAAYTKDIANLQSLITQAPDREDLVYYLADSLSWVGSILEHQGRPTDAGLRFRDAADILNELHAQHPANRPYEDRLVSELAQLARLQIVLGEFDSALALYQEALGHSGELVKHDPQNQPWRRSLALLHLGSAEALRRMNRPAEADEHARLGLEETRLLAEADPTNTDWVQLHSRGQAARALTALALGDGDTATRMAMAALETLARAPAGRDRMVAAARAAEIRLVAGDVARATGAAETAMLHWEAGLAALADPGGPERYPRLLLLRGELLDRLGRCEEAIEAWRKLQEMRAWAPQQSC
jgi:eukaryotic-like serine/threonine-protein kinase